MNALNPNWPQSWNWTAICSALAASLFIGIWLACSFHTTSNWLAFPQFLIAVSVLFILPGNMLFRRLKLTATPIETLVLNACLGMVATCVLYGILCWLKAPGLLWIWVLMALWQAWPGSWALRFRDTPLRPEHFLLLLVLAAGFMPLLLIRYFFRNLSSASDGSISYFAQPPDFVLHAAITGELTHTFPPQVPYFSGQPLSYHVGMDMVMAILARFGGLSIDDLVVRLCPMLFVVVAMLAIFCLGRRLTGSGTAGAALAFLTILGEDFSFIPALLRRHQIFLDIFYFHVPTVLSAYAFNPMILGLGVFFAGLFCLHQSMTLGRWGWFFAAALCLAALIEIKIFLFVLFALTCVVVAPLEFATRGRIAVLRLGLLLALLGSPFGLYILLTNQGAGDFTWTWSPLLVTDLAASASHWGVIIASIAAIIRLVLYLIGVFGYRSFGVTELCRSLKPARDNSFDSLLAVFVVLGAVLGLVTEVVPRSGPIIYNNAVWFFVASKFVAPIFAILAFVHCWPRAVRWQRFGMIALIALISMPSMIGFVFKASADAPVLHWDAAEMTAIKTLNQVAMPGDVVLPTVPDFDTLLMTTTRLRLPCADFVFVATTVDHGKLASRQRDIRAFRQAWSAGRMDMEVAARYRVAWIFARRRTGSMMSRAPGLKPFFDNAEIAIYRVEVPASILQTVAK